MLKFSNALAATSLAALALMGCSKKEAEAAQDAAPAQAVQETVTEDKGETEIMTRAERAGSQFGEVDRISRRKWQERGCANDPKRPAISNFEQGRGNR